jgi:hypothetical protein
MMRYPRLSPALGLLCSLATGCSTSAGGGGGTATDGGSGTTTAGSGGGSSGGATTGGSTTAAGSSGGGPVLTYWKDIAPITYEACAGCHREGGAGPFAMNDWDQVHARASDIEAHTGARTMPPIPVDDTGVCRTYSDVRWLTDEEIAQIAAWEAGGAVEGDPADAPTFPAAPAPLEGITHSMGLAEPYTPTINDDYRCFVVDPGIAADGYVTGFQVNPDNGKIVHHVILYAPETPTAEQALVDADAADAGPGYACLDGAGSNLTMIAGWAPGTRATDYPAGTGLAITGGRRLVMQVHYNLDNLQAGDPADDQTTLDLRVADTVTNEAVILPLVDPSINISPGQGIHEETDSQAFPNYPTGRIWGVFPHMHRLGVSMSVTVDGECAMEVPRWNFNWQGLHFYDEPIDVSGGAEATITCRYDSDETDVPVHWGEGTSDEMCLNYFYVSYGL